jgi:hypothetical protein
MFSINPLAPSGFSKRTTTIGVLATAMLVLLSGCSGTESKTPGTPQAGTGTAGPGSTPPPAPKPAELFAAAVAKLGGQNVKYTIEGDKGEKMTGVFDAASGGNQLSANIEGTKMEIVALGNDIYIGGLTGKDKWMHAQASKFKDNAISFLMLIDPLFGQKFLGAAVDVKQDQPTAYSGTVDLTKVNVTGNAKRLADRFAKTAGPAATALPFIATMDASGALSTVKMTFPKADLGGKDLKYNLTVTEAGGAAAVTAPPQNKVSEAPASIYTGP